MVQSLKKRKVQVKTQSRIRLKTQQKPNFQKKAIVLKKKETYLKTNIYKYNNYLFSFLSALKAYRLENRKLLGFSNGIELKTLSYRFFKDTKILKSGSNSIESVNFLPQISKLFSSKIEKQKKKKMGTLRKKGLTFLKRTFFPFSFSKKDGSLEKRRSFKSFWFLKRKQSEFLKICKKKSISFKFKRPLSFSKPVLNRRLILHKIKIAEKKKYKKLHSFLFLKRNNLRSLLKYYIIGRRKFKFKLNYKVVRTFVKVPKFNRKFLKPIQKQLNPKKKRQNFDTFFQVHDVNKSINFLKKDKFFFKNKAKSLSRSVTRIVQRSGGQARLRNGNYKYFRSSTKRRKKMMQRLVKKWNRKKKWKRRGVFKFFRSKLKFLNNFSVPRHFEINYKTGEILYLGFIDSSSVDLRLPFKLNIRRLTTYFSS